jgi:quercetin dioxygenase-like cupin family protein
VTWAPYVFDAAKSYGLVLLESGRLIDTTQGQVVPEGARLMTPTTAADVERLKRYSSDDLRAIVQPEAGMPLAAESVIAARAAGRVIESPIVGGPSEPEGVPAGKMAWPHGFHLRRLVLEPGARIPDHVRGEEEVLLMYRGTLRFESEGEVIDLGPGDVFSVPRNLGRRYVNTSADRAVVYVVRGGDHPGAPTWM